MYLVVLWIYDVMDVPDQPANGKGFMSRRHDASFRQASRDVIDQCDGSMRWINVMDVMNLMNVLGHAIQPKGGFMSRREAGCIIQASSKGGNKGEDWSAHDMTRHER